MASATGNKTYETPNGVKVDSAGTYYSVASYTVVHNHPGSTLFPYTTLFRSAQAGPSIETTQDPDHGLVGLTYKDKATLAGIFGEHPGGSVSWKQIGRAHF